MSVIKTEIKKCRYSDGETLKLNQRSECMNHAERQSIESSELEFGVWQGTSDRQPFCGVAVKTSYEYESGRTSNHFTMVRLDPEQYRDIANHMLALADLADAKNNDSDT